MPLSQKEVDCLMHGLEEEFRKAFTDRDAKAIAELYHPQATLVFTGVKCDYGREAILKTYQEFMAAAPAPFQIFPELNAEAANGEYLITRGKYTWKDDEKKHYEQVFKKGADGKYLIYHDEFTP
ncbi:hypothetical protein DdX_17669 [Ditylenchus destructor]|uniref:DUF4440 domain-containing protein n=1 Tax=Ditylenchus destructor TaxID=166010 RepID=A0AAD4QYZ4_9BILA|nr:hypothetical protein DdX_17669 [Ditylenchus destructor]